MSIDTDIGLIDNAESGETVRGAIIRVIQDLNQNGGNAQTLNNHNSDAFTKKTEFDNFVDNEVGAIHQVLDAINKGTTLKVIDLGEHEIGPAADTLRIEVPRSISDRSLLTVDDFYADIVSVAGGNGANANWTKSATYDSVSGIYSYSYGALATAITLHFYVKRASAIAVTDYDVHPLAEEIRSNDEYTAPDGEAWNYVKVNVPGSKTETTLEANENRTYEQPQQSNEVWNKVIVNVPAPTPSLQEGEVTVRQPSYDTTFTPTSPNVGFSSFRVKAEVPEPVIQRDKAVTLTTNNTTVNVAPDTGKDAMDSVAVTVEVPEQSIETGRSVTYNSGGTYTVNPSGDYDAMDSVEVTVQTPRLQPSKSVTLSQSGTVTPDPNFDAMEEVVVTVSGGGGGNCYIVDQATWDALPFAEKKKKGLTVIRNSAGQITGHWMDYANIILNIIGEFYGKLLTVIQLDQQNINHLIYFQGKWEKNGWDNGLINHTGVAYSSMDSGNETIRNGSGVTNKMISILHDVNINSGATITFSIGAQGYDINDGAFAVGVPFASTVEIIGEHFSSSAETIVTNKHYDYVLFMANKWSYGQDSSNGTYSISSGTLVESGAETIVVDGTTVPAIAVYSNVPSGTTITLGNRETGTIDSAVAIGINETTS